MSSSSSRWLPAAALVVLLAAACSGAKPATPSQLVAGPADFDGQSVSVSGTVKNPRERTTRRGQMQFFQLCDSACVNVVEFGQAAAVTEGANASVTGTFHQDFGRRRHMSNVVVVGGRRT